jgi:hypothetical protein
MRKLASLQKLMYSCSCASEREGCRHRPTGAAEQRFGSHDRAVDTASSPHLVCPKPLLFVLQLLLLLLVPAQHATVKPHLACRVSLPVPPALPDASPCLDQLGPLLEPILPGAGQQPLDVKTCVWWCDNVVVWWCGVRVCSIAAYREVTQAGFSHSGRRFGRQMLRVLKLQTKPEAEVAPCIKEGTGGAGVGKDAEPGSPGPDAPAAKRVPSSPTLASPDARAPLCRHSRPCAVGRRPCHNPHRRPAGPVLGFCFFLQTRASGCFVPHGIVERHLRAAVDGLPAAGRGMSRWCFPARR